MKWTEVRMRVATEASEAVSNALIEEGAGGVATQDPSFVDLIKHGWIWSDRLRTPRPGPVVTVIAYYPNTDSIGPRMERLRGRLLEIGRAGLDLGPNELTTAEVDEADWVDAWKAYFKPRRIGRRMVVRPSWEEYDAAPGDVVVVLDPGMAFGTGTHETTADTLVLLEEAVKGGEEVVDCGTGTGILAAFAARLGAARVHGVDNDEVAVAAARANIAANGVDDRVTVDQGDAGAYLDGLAAGTTDLITANLMANLLIRMAPSFVRALKPGGRVIGSGVTALRRDDVARAFGRAGLRVIREKTSGDWVTLLAEKPATGKAKTGGWAARKPARDRRPWG